VAARALVTKTFEFAFRPDLATIALIPLGSIVLAVLAAFAAAQPALNARPAEGLRAL
jgi:predicted lysophospholipase L1 biosynthesis ABC-type transport system permease subunit